MKFLITFALFMVVFVVASHAALSEEFKAKAMKKIQKVAAECAQAENANGDDMKELMAKKPPTRKEGKCMLACFNAKFGSQGEDGKFIKEGALSAIEPFKAEDSELYDKLMQVAEKCFAEHVDVEDRCENAAKMNECGLRVSKEMGLNEKILM